MAKLGLKDAALAYAGHGMNVFPLLPGGKTPLTKQGFKDATSDTSQVERWWEEHPEANIGFAVPEKVVVVDIDSPIAAQELRASDCDLPTTVTCKTPRGSHFWYRLSNGQKVVPRVSVFPGVDFRSGGSYVILPPSRRKDGTSYEWLVPPDRNNFSEVPDWVLEMGSEKDGIFVSDPVEASDVLEGVGEGMRDITLFRYACQLRTRGMSRAEADALVQAAAAKCVPPFPSDVAKRKVDQAWKYSVDEEKSRDGIRIYTCKELLDTDFPKPLFLVEQILPEGLTILVSPPKLGKSFLAGALSTAIVHENGFALGHLKTATAPVFFLDLEQDEIQGKARWETVTFNQDIPKDLFITFKWPEIGQGFYTKLQEFLDEHPAVRLVVIDVLSKIWPEVDQLKGNAYHKEYKILSRLKDFAKENRISVLLLHHFRKSADGMDILGQVSGSTAMTGVPDTVWILRRPRGERGGELYVTSRGTRERTFKLNWDHLLGGWEIVRDEDRMPT